MSLFSMIRADTWDQDALRRKSLKLAKLLRNDFSDIAAELAAVFPNTCGLQERYVPLVSRVAHELSGLYARPVVREFKSATGDASGFVDVYKRLRFDRFLHDVHRQLLVQHTIVVVALPGPRPGDVRLSAFAPWQIEWDTADLQFAHDLDSARKLTLSVPVEQKANLLVFGQLVLTPTEAYKVVGGVRQPVYGATTANPLGRIPAVVLRLEEPLAGRWASPVNEALLAMTIALCVSESDTELLVHTQAWGQKVIKNAQVAQQVEELRVGPDKLLALVNQEPGSIGPELAIVQGQPPLAQITGWNESRLRLLCSMFDLSPDAFLKVNTAVTASARAYDARDREESKDRVLPLFADAENDLARLIAETHNLRAVGKLPTDVTVTCQYTQGEQPPADPLHEAQALAQEVALGVKSRVELIARRDGLTYAEAFAKVKRNLDEARALGIVTAPPPAAAADANDDDDDDDDDNTGDYADDSTAS